MGRQIVYLLQATNEIVDRYCKASTVCHLQGPGRMNSGVIRCVLSTMKPENYNQVILSTRCYPLGSNCDYLASNASPRNVSTYDSQQSLEDTNIWPTCFEWLQEITKELRCEWLFQRDDTCPTDSSTLLRDRLFPGFFAPLLPTTEQLDAELFVNNVIVAVFDATHDRVRVLGTWSYQPTSRNYCEETDEEDDEQLRLHTYSREIFFSKLFANAPLISTLLLTDIPYLQISAKARSSSVLRSTTSSLSTNNSGSCAVVLFSPCLPRCCPSTVSRKKHINLKGLVFKNKLATHNKVNGCSLPQETKSLCSEFRIAHNAQLPHLAAMLFEGLKSHSLPFPLTSFQLLKVALGLQCPVIAYLLIAAKAKRFHCLDIFSSSRKALFLPVCVSLPLESQFRCLSVAPTSFLFKISDYWGNLEQKTSQDVLKQLSHLLNYWSRLRHPVFVPAPLDAQRLLLDRFQFLEFLGSCIDALNGRICSSSERRPLNNPISVVKHLFLNWPAILDPTDSVATNLRDSINPEAIKPLRYPVICKPRLGGGPPMAHHIGVAFTPEGVIQFVKNISANPSNKFKQPDANQRFNYCALSLPDSSSSSSSDSSSSDSSSSSSDSSSSDDSSSSSSSSCSSSSSGNSSRSSLRKLSSGSWTASLRSSNVQGIVIQDYVAHGVNPVVLKVFSLGVYMHIHPQRSIPSPFTADGIRRLRALGQVDAEAPLPNCIMFNSSVLKSVDAKQSSQLMSTLAPLNSAFDTVRGSTTTTQNTAHYQRTGPVFLANEVYLWQLTQILRERLKTSFFGYDVLVVPEDLPSQGIRELDHGHGPYRLGETLVVVDINFFPSYSGVSGLREQLRQAALP